MNEIQNEIHDKVKAKIKGQGRTITWVASQIGLSRESLCQRLIAKTQFKTSELKNISIVLGLGPKFNWFE